MPKNKKKKRILSLKIEKPHTLISLLHTNMIFIQITGHGWDRTGWEL